MQNDARVLIVESEPLACEMIRELLEEIGYVVAGIAVNGHQAIEMTQSIRPDVVLMDIGLPDMDGLEATQRIQESCPTPVVILTASDAPELVERASAAGAGAYLVKPPEAREVERAITLTMARFDDMIALRCMNAELQAEIAERVRTEEALRASEANYQELVQNANSVILRLDTQGRITFLNEFAQSFFGYAEGEILGQNAVGTIVPERETSGRDLVAMIKDITQRPERYINNENENIRRNGERVWIVWTNKAILDDERRVTEILCIGNDITERKRVDNLIRTQRDLGRALSAVPELGESLRLCVEAALHVSGMDCGGVYLVDETSGALDLVFHKGLPPDFIKSVSHYDADSANARLVMAGKPVYTEHLALGVPLDETRRHESLRAIAVVPMHHEGRAIGCLNIASHTLDEVPVFARDALETIAAQIGSSIARLRAEEALKRRLEQLAALSQASQAVTASLELDQVLTEVVSLASEVVASDYTSIVLVDENGQMGQSAEDVPGIPAIEYRIRNDGLASWVIHSGQPVIVDEIGEDGAISPDLGEGAPRFANPHIVEAGVRSVASLPLSVKGNLLGIIFLHSMRPCNFRGQLPLLTALVNQVAIAVENAHLYQAAQQEIIERKRAEEALRESEARYRDVALSTSDWIWEVDSQGHYTYCSEQVMNVLGYAVEEILGKTPFDLMPPDEATRVGKIFGEIAKNRVPIVDLENWNISRDGHKVCLLTNGVPMFDRESNFIGYRGVDKDITERKRAEEQLKISLKEKEVLLKEIHHRVKNNLQVVSSLLNLQANYVEDGQVIEMLQESRNRVRSMALVHEKLYRSPDLARVDFAEYIRNLAAQLFRSYRVHGRGIILKIEVTDVALGIDTAVPCGLIVNELLSNALKHAFPEGREGEIRIGLSSDQKFTLTVADNGVGFPSDLDFRNTESLGLQLVATLVAQLDGSIELDRSDGTTFKIEFAEQR